MTWDTTETGEERQDEASAWEYHLPEELIAARPAEKRDASRLMVVPEGAPPVHAHFRDLPRFLRPGDLLVMNDSRVLPARLYGTRRPGGGACEVLLLSPHEAASDGAERWSALVRPGKKLKPGIVVDFAENFSGEVEADLGGGEKLIRFRTPGGLREALEQYGNMPLPPYILAKRGEKRTTDEDRERYQTIYARVEGSVAAPTAGLHFTEEVFRALDVLGVERTELTLHVGAGTFQPVTTEKITDHPMHEETWEVPEAAAEAVTRARREGRRVIAVGTTTVRTLETAAEADGTLKPGRGVSDLMIAPGYRFRALDGMITNFHLPRSTLLLLVAALVGRKRLFSLYEEAIREKYRFYSYGDAMLLWHERRR